MVPFLAQALSVDSFSARKAASTLAGMGSEARAATHALAAALGSDDIEVRLLAAYALGEIGPSANAAVPGLRAARDRDPQLRNNVTEALRKIENEGRLE